MGRDCIRKQFEMCIILLYIYITVENQNKDVLCMIWTVSLCITKFIIFYVLPHFMQKAFIVIDVYVDAINLFNWSILTDASI